MPEVLEQPIFYHHAPGQCVRFPREAAVCHIANRLAHRYGMGCSADDSDDLLDDPFIRVIGGDATWLNRMDVWAPGLFEVARQIIA
jgi:hypothetical protein